MAVGFTKERPACGAAERVRTSPVHGWPTRIWLIGDLMPVGLTRLAHTVATDVQQTDIAHHGDSAPIGSSVS